MEHLDSDFKGLVEEVRKGSHASPTVIIKFANNLQKGALRMMRKNKSIEREMMNIARAAKVIIGDITTNRPLHEIIGLAGSQLPIINDNLKAAAIKLKYQYQEIAS